MPQAIKTAQKLGNDRATGKLIGGIDHLRQSIHDIIFTPIGSCVMRRDYGSYLPRLIDSPANADNLVKIYASIAHALATWEPRLILERVINISTKAESQKGRFNFEIQGDYLGDKVRFEVAL